MNKIDEITLRVGCELWGEFHPRVTDYNEVKQLTLFANALLAELSKDAEPVASVSVGTRTGLDGHVLKFDYGAALRMAVPASGKPIPLFAHPANTKAAIQAAYEQGKRDAVPDWQSIATVPNDTTKVLVFSPKFGVWETTGRYALQPKGDSGWIPIAWKLSAQSSDEVLAAIAAALKQEK